MRKMNRKMLAVPAGIGAALVALQLELVVAGLGPLQSLRLLDIYDLNPIL